MRQEGKVPLEYKDRTVCILGLGFVGLTLATAMADVGFQVIGVEIREELLNQLASGNPYFFEPGLATQLKKNIQNGSFRAYKEIPKDCGATVYIITVGTPLDENRIINLSSIQKISEEIAKQLKENDMVILRSTVKLGTTRSCVLPTLSKANKRFQIAFCPERTVEGQALAELRYLPQIIGADDLPTRIRAAQIFHFLTPTVVQVSDLETAEMIKLIDNAKRDVAFGFSNEVARLCDAAGLSACEVITSGRFGYTRTDLAIPGLVGGPCLSKDSHILAQSMKKYGIIPEIAVAARKTNETHPLEIVDFLIRLIQHKMDSASPLVISLLGIAFKGRPATDDIRGTTAKPIYKALKERFPQAIFWGYDPVVESNTIKEFGLIPKVNITEATSNAHLVLILNNHPLFAELPVEKIALEMARPGIIYDFWNHYHPNTLALPDGVDYITLGSHKYATHLMG
jgi:nucleotide sugar dehydrogenase